MVGDGDAMSVASQVLPWYIKMLAALAGAHGDRTGGLAMVQRVAESGNYAREDARFMLDVLYQREKRLQTFTHAL